MSDTKLCKDCVHCRPTRHYTTGELGGHEWHTYDTARCALTDLVMGTGIAGRLCADERAPLDSSIRACGRPGGNFEPLPETPVKPEIKRRWWSL